MELYSFVRDTLIAYRILVEDVFDFLSFVLEANHINFFIFAFDFESNVLNLFHGLIDSII